MKETFTNIFLNNSWKDNESFSGPSSTLARTETLRKALPIIFEKYNVNRVFDAPCGDFNWMQHVVKDIENIQYLGGDIVKELIETNKSMSNKNIDFIEIDIVNDNLPVADLMIARDFMFHLSYDDNYKFLNNFIKSGTPYLLTTTHININNSLRNRDIQTGGWRYIDLFLPPFSFDSFTKESIIDGGGDRFMCLWDRSQIERAVIDW